MSSEPSRDLALDPMAAYREKIAGGEIVDDPAQRFVVEKLSLLARRLDQPPPERGFVSAVFGWGREKIEEGALKGLYIHGQVGRGKTMLMGLFASAVGARAYRVHFHEFMQEVHARLTSLRKEAEADPVQALGEEIAARARVLCIDEMQIENIADAMIVGRLFEAIFAKGTILITTSNQHPDALYSGGLNRHRFTPFIEQIKHNTEIIDLAGGRDYRREDGAVAGSGAGKEERVYIGKGRAKLDAIWQRMVPDPGEVKVRIGGREWLLMGAGRVARTDFADICEEARGAADYHALAKAVDALIIDKVPRLDTGKTSAASRFITLIDILYEEKVSLYLALEHPLEELHSDPATSAQFQRTLSRLEEMKRPGWGR